VLSLEPVGSKDELQKFVQTADLGKEPHETFPFDSCFFAFSMVLAGAGGFGHTAFVIAYTKDNLGLAI
jgi:hypothetical protein